MLCVVEDTLVLTDRGFAIISDLCHDQPVSIWNGKTFVKTDVTRSVSEKHIMAVTLSNGMQVMGAPSQLEVGDVLDPWALPIMHKYVAPMVNDNDNDTISSPSSAFVHGYCAGISSTLNKPVNTMSEITIVLNPKMVKQFDDACIPRSSMPGLKTTEAIFNVRGLEVSVLAVPFNETLRYKMQWLTGLSEATGFPCMETRLSCTETRFLAHLQLLLLTLGVQAWLDTSNDTLLHIEHHVDTTSLVKHRARTIALSGLSVTRKEDTGMTALVYGMADGGGGTYNGISNSKL